MRKRQVGVVESWLEQVKSGRKVGSMFFEGDTIYSYGKHFPIARIVRGAVLYNHETYSATTSSHQAIVRRYVRQNRMHLFSVGSLVTENPSAKHVVAYQSEIDRCATRLQACRINLQYRLAWLQSWFDEGVQFKHYFHLDPEGCPIRLPANLPELIQRSVRFRLGGIEATNKMLRQHEMPKTVDWVIMENILQSQDELLIAMRMTKYRSELKGQTNE